MYDVCLDVATQDVATQDVATQDVATRRVSTMFAPLSVPCPCWLPQDLRRKLGDNHRESKKAAKALLEVQQRIPQVTAELQKLEARRSGGAAGAAGAAGSDASAALRAELRQLEARRVEAGKKAAAKQAQLATIEAEVADLQVGGWMARCGWVAWWLVAVACCLGSGWVVFGGLTVCGACLLRLPSSSATADAAPVPAAAAASPTGAHR